MGLVLISPAVAIYGTRVRCISRARLEPISTFELSGRFQEGQSLDVADCAADLDDRHIGVPGAQDPALDFVGDMRDDLTVPPR